MLFGLVCVKAWNYWWGYTSAQIDLMIADSPLIVYDKCDDGKKKHTKKEMDELVRRWKEKKEREAQEGKKMDINDFLRTDIPKEK